MHDNKKDCECQTVEFSVYVIWCRCTNQFYVGVTSREVEQRILEHKRKKHQYIDREIQRIGWEGNWDWWVIEKNISSDKINEREQQFVKFFDCRYPKGYNKTCGGIKFFRHTEETKAQMRSRRHTEEEKAKISKGNRGKKRTEEQRANIRNSHLGKKLTEEQVAKIAKGNRGKKRTEEFKENIRQSRLGKKHTEETKAILREKALARNMSGENHPMYGKHHTEEAKEAIRQAHLGNSTRKGIPCSEETKAILREKALERDVSGEKNPFFGKKHTEEAKEKNRQAHLGKPLSEEHKAKLREKSLASWAKRKAAKAVAEENLAAANTTPTNLSNLLDAVIFQ